MHPNEKQENKHPIARLHLSGKQESKIPYVRMHTTTDTSKQASKMLQAGKKASKQASKFQEWMKKRPEENLQASCKILPNKKACKQIASMLVAK